MSRQVARLVLSSAIALGLHAPIARRIAAATEEVTGAPADDGTARRLTVLALSPHMFRGDLEMLAHTGAVRVLKAPYAWQTRLLRRFYDDDINPPRLHQPQGDHAVQQAAYRGFLRGLLPRLFARLGVDVVIGADVRYIADTDWGVIAQELGVPYIVFHRENMLAARTIYETVRDRQRMIGRFQGTHVVVHNEACRQMFVDSGYVPAERVSVIGAMRMDAYRERLARERDAPVPRPGERAMIVLFTFWHARPWFDYPRRVFDGAHQAFARFAAAHPEVDVVFKPKPEDLAKSPMETFIREALDEIGLSFDDLPNLAMRPDLDAQAAIARASVVAGMDSTVIPEAAVSGKPVVIPYFEEIRRPPFNARIKFHDQLDLFDLPRDPDDMLAILERRFADPTVDQATMAGRRALFERYVSPLDGKVTERYVALLHDLAEGRAAA